MGGEVCLAAGALRSLPLRSPILREGIALSTDGGGVYRIVLLLSAIALCFAGDEEGAPLLAGTRPRARRRALRVARVDKGTTSLVAEIHIAESTSAPPRAGRARRRGPGADRLGFGARSRLDRMPRRPPRRRARAPALSRRPSE